MTTAPDVRVELYLRALAPRAGPERVERIRTDLSRLVSEGVVSDYSTTVWGDALPTDGDHALVDRVAAFRSWAAETGVTLVGVEQRRTGTLVDELETVWTLPTIALAEYHDDELVRVTPHEHDGAVHTVADRLGALAERDDDPDGRELVASD